MTERPWAFSCYTPSRGEVAAKIARAYPTSAFGAAVRPYNPPASKGLQPAAQIEARQWLWACTRCRNSAVGYRTRQEARDAKNQHDLICSGEERDHVREARKLWESEQAEARRRRPQSIATRGLEPTASPEEREAAHDTIL